jgi:hypothetical protein
VLDPSGISNDFSGGTFTVATNANALVVNFTKALVPPTLSGCGLASGGAFVLSFSGPSGQTYQVLSSPDLAVPLTNWAAVASGTFGASPANYTNLVSDPQRFYQIKSP